MHPFSQQNALEKNATFSQDGQYRFTLKRDLANDAPPVAFIMLNPSTADHNVDDPTIRRCIGFANKFEASTLYVVNLFAYRTKNPTELKKCPYPISNPEIPEMNDLVIRFIIYHIRESRGTVIAAWGNHGTYRERGDWVSNYFKDVDIFCFGHTATGQPRHPLYLKKYSPLYRL